MFPGHNPGGKCEKKCMAYTILDTGTVTTLENATSMFRMITHEPLDTRQSNRALQEIQLQSINPFSHNTS